MYRHLCTFLGKNHVMLSSMYLRKMYKDFIMDVKYLEMKHVRFIF